MSYVPHTKKPLILLPENISPTQLFAVAAFYSYLREQLIDVTIGVVEDREINTALTRLIPNVKIINKLTPPQVQSTLKISAANLEKVDWQQNEGEVSLTLNFDSKTHVIPFDWKKSQVKQLGEVFDLLIFPGVAELAELGEFAKEIEPLLATTKIFMVGAEPNWGEDLDINSSNLDGLASLAEQLVRVFDIQLMKKPTADYLLAGIFWDTAGFTRDVANSEVFLTVKKLIDKGGLLSKAQELISKLALES